MRGQGIRVEDLGFMDERLGTRCDQRPQGFRVRGNLDYSFRGWGVGVRV